MMYLVTAVIGEHFSLFVTGDEINDGKVLSPDVIKMSGRVENHLTGLPFIKKFSNEAGGFDQDGADAFGLYGESFGIKSYGNRTNV